MNEVLIRDAAVGDANGIAHVQVTAWLETYRGLISDEKAYGWKDIHPLAGRGERLVGEKGS